MTAALTMSFEVACSTAHAFDTWTSRIDTWWPRDHTVTGDGASLELQPGVGGRIVERGADGSEHVWGEITTWEPPAVLGYRWHLGRDASYATDVVIRFVADGPGTRVDIEHTGWDRLEDAEVWRGRNRVGWDTLLPHFTYAITHTDNERQRGRDRMTGSKDDPWQLRTAPGSSAYVMWRDEAADPPALVCQVGTTTLRYHLTAVEDLHAWLLAQGDWVDLGATDEQKPAPAGTVEAWGRDEANPVGGWYGLRKGYRGRFGMYLPPLLEQLGLAELTHDKRNNRTRGIR